MSKYLLSEEFYRMQELAGIQSKHNGILLEFAGDNKIQQNYQKLQPESKEFVQNIIDNIKQAGYSPKEIFQELNKLKVFKNSKDFLTTFQSIITPKKSLDEADKGSFTELSQLDQLEPGDTFKWDGDSLPDAEYKDAPINLDDKSKKKGLQPGVAYTVLSGYDDGNIQIPPAIVSLRQKKYIDNSKEGGVLGSLRKKFPKLLKGFKTFMPLLAVASVLQGVAAPTIGLAADIAVEGRYGTDGALAQEDAQGVIKLSQDSDFDQNADEVIKPISGGNVDISTDANEVINDVEANNVNTQGVDFSDNDDNATTAQTYETGEGDLTEEEINKSADELVKKTIEDLNNKFKQNKNQKLNKIDLEIDYGSSVSHNQGDDSNVANDGGDLNAKRLNSSEKVAKIAGEKIEKIIKKAYGEDFDLNIKYKKVNTTDGIDDQKIQDAKDNLETQSSFQKIKNDIETSEKGDPIKLLYFQFLAPDLTPGGKEEPQPDKPKGKDESPNKKEKTEDVPPTPVRVNQDVESIGKFNRNGQIGFVLARTSPNLNIYTELGEKNITSLTDTQLNNIIKDEYKGNQTSDKAKKLAKLIITLRKSPESLTKKYSGILGVTLKPRAKAISTQPGKGTQAQLQKIQEIKNKTLLYLTEAMIDDIFNEFGVTDDDVKNKKVQLLSLLGSMYASEEDNTLSILNTDELSDEEKKQLQGLGFNAQPGGNYVFLGKGQTKKTYFDKLQQKNKTQPDNERIAKTLSQRKNLQSLLKRIDTVDEFKDLILAIFSQNNEFLDPEFKKDKNKIKSVFFSLRNRIQETELKDVSSTVKAILDDSTLKSQLQKINTVEETIQLILREIIPYLSPTLIKDKTKLKNAIISVVNSYTQTSSSKAKPSTTGNTSSTGTTNVSYTLTKENKTMKGQLLNEEFNRMQKLAGIITEEMIGGVNFDAQAAAEIKSEQPDLSKLAPYILDKGNKVIMNSSGKLCIYDGSTLKKIYNSVEDFLTGISYNPMKLK